MNLPSRPIDKKSLSARRAWIEIQSNTYHPHFHVVALRKESVDRNFDGVSGEEVLRPSLSARRAWIEIAKHLSICVIELSLSARRAWIEIPKIR